MYLLIILPLHANDFTWGLDVHPCVVDCPLMRGGNSAVNKSDDGLRSPECRVPSGTQNSTLLAVLAHRLVSTAGGLRL